MWTAVGFLGASIFGSRFVLQWLQSEKEKKLVVPWYFWHLSFWGSVLNLLYFMHLDKAPLIFGNCFLPFLYGRNIFFLRKQGTRGGRKVFAVVVVLVLVGFGYTKFFVTSIFINTPEGRMQSEVAGFINGVNLYKLEFGSLPPGDARSIIRALMGDNAEKTNFVGIPLNRLTPKDDWLDPWGHPYRIFISGKSFLIRSAGPNGKFDDGSDKKRDDILIESSVP